jgi:hypothetical protein
VPQINLFLFLIIKEEHMKSAELLINGMILRSFSVFLMMWKSAHFHAIVTGRLRTTIKSITCEKLYMGSQDPENLCDHLLKLNRYLDYFSV